MDRSFDLILPKFTLKCPYHPSQSITKGCTDYKCSKNSLCCPQCEHHTESHLKSLEEFVLCLSENIENLSIDNSKLYEEIFLSSENANLSKWQEDNTEHLKKVEDHLIAQKVLIAEDMANLISQISETCQNVKMELMNKLDDYFTNYKNNFNGFKNLLDESFIINKKYKYYGNVNNLAAKISGELPKNLNLMINAIKNVIIKSQEISENRKITIKKFKKMADELNELTNSLPFYKNSLSYDKFSDELSIKINKYFISQIDFPSSQNQDPAIIGIFNKKVLEKLDINKENPVQKSRSKPSEKIFESRAEPLKIDILPSFNNYLDPLNKTNYSSDNKCLIVSTNTNKYLTDFSLKLQKMIQIDFPITCANVISDNLLALGGKDSFLRVYDIKMQKVIYTVAAHNEPIVSLSRIFSDDKLINPQLVNNGKKRILLASSSLDKTVYIWLISEGGNPSIYQKLAGFFAPIQSFLELEDGVCLITGDTNGELIVWDYHKAKVLFVFRGQHSSKISGFQMLKKNEKFLVASQDNAISIWKMKYNKNSVYPENFNIEKIICDSFGGISCIVSPIPDKDILVIGSIDGMIRIYDYQNKLMIAELPGYKNSVHEIAAISEKNNGKNEDKQFVIVSCCLDEKMLKYWIVNKKEGKNEYGIVSEKYEDYGIVSGLDRKNKIQLVGTIPTLLLLDEIKGQIVILETNLK